MSIKMNAIATIAPLGEPGPCQYQERRHAKGINTSLACLHLFTSENQGLNFFF